MLVMKGKLINVNAIFKGIQLLLEVCGAVEGRSREQCVQILKVCCPLDA